MRIIPNKQAESIILALADELDITPTDAMRRIVVASEHTVRTFVKNHKLNKENPLYIPKEVAHEPVPSYKPLTQDYTE